MQTRSQGRSIQQHAPHQQQLHQQQQQYPQHTQHEQEQYQSRRPNYPQATTTTTTTQSVPTSPSSSLFNSSSSISSMSSITAPSAATTDSSPTMYQQQPPQQSQPFISAPLPSPSTNQPATYFASLAPQQPPSQRRQDNRFVGQRGGDGGIPETAPFLHDFNLVAEAAKRAQMACLARDLGDVGL
ncbi:hypothetical protein BDY17DRAFT_322966 [Neohortaea acidophila]|uniref:Uncharacterized protein n=1 Tax=Neohortaea acidophila TaxID=245834 RepID=A0A6A6PWH4_9PEZI|nr:uncharacterized protein BDY17DRAFT_322966 [Neohortaea acidophila]KAF2484091.1 hypothetical protein BDY17DRAFT_322966 [Neohortaea acidophila]